MPDDVSLDDSYDAFPRVEAAFQRALDESLDPRGPEVLYELVASLGLPSSARVVDVGCGEGDHTIGLARQFGFEVLGVDPVARHVELGRAAQRVTAAADVGIGGRIRFERGRAENLPLADGSVDLVWCREVLMYAPSLDRAFDEFRRVLRPSGRGLVYQVCTGPRMDDREADHFWREVGDAAFSVRPEALEAAIARAGLVVDEQVALTGEWGERAEETGGAGTRRLLHVARLLRAPDRYIEQFDETTESC